MRLKYLTVLFAILAFSVAAIACSGGDDNGGQPATTTETPVDGDDGNGNGDDNGDQPAATTETPIDGGDGNGSGNGAGAGNAVLTIGDESWEFDDVFCAFSPEESRNARVSFTLTSFAESSTGARTQLDATIQDPDEQGRYDGENVIKSVSLNDVEDFENPSVAWSSLSLFSNGETDIQVNGKNVTVEAAFDDDRTDEIESVSGTLTATCP